MKRVLLFIGLACAISITGVQELSAGPPPPGGRPAAGPRPGPAPAPRHAPRGPRGPGPGPGPRGPSPAAGFVGGVLGAIIGSAISSAAQSSQPQASTPAASPKSGSTAKRRTTSKKTYARKKTSAKAGISTAQREANREVQTALNYFGFPAGTPDGAIGPKSRAAIAQYQETLDYPATGQLTEYERTLLVNSYHRAIAGGLATQQQIAAHPMGVRGLLLTYRDEAAGAAPQAPSAVATAPQKANSNADVISAVSSQPEPGASGTPSLPSFLGGDTTQVSLASHCNKVILTASTKGGFTTASSMTDPMLALDEQFCLARSHAIVQGEEMAARIQDYTPQQIAQQCEGFGPALKDQVTALSLKPASEVIAGVRGFALSTGMAPAQLADTAKICLSVGYRTDNMDVALGSALLLPALGERAYGELMGHHLAQGFGVARRPDLALAWYDMGFEALAPGGAPVFAPDHPERGDLIREAIYAIGGKAGREGLATAVVPASLPSFGAGAARAPSTAPEPRSAAPAVPYPIPAAEDRPVVQETAPEIAAEPAPATDR